MILESVDLFGGSAYVVLWFTFWRTNFHCCYLTLCLAYQTNLVLTTRFQNFHQLPHSYTGTHTEGRCRWALGLKFIQIPTETLSASKHNYRYGSLMHGVLKLTSFQRNRKSVIMPRYTLRNRSKSTGSFSFLKLPAEIRNSIYLFYSRVARTNCASEKRAHSKTWTPHPR